MPNIIKAREVGRLIKTQRNRLGLSISRLAELSGVGKSTISRWESGAYQPDTPVLDSVLAALGAAPDVRLQALELIGTPRAIRVIRQGDQDAVASASELGLSAPAIGSLVRAMRRRKKLGVGQLAETLGVSPGAVSLWEASERFPQRETIRRLCELLDAGVEERSALTSGSLNVSLPGQPSTIEELRLIFERREMPWPEASQRYWQTFDLRFLMIEDLLWKTARKSGGSLELLAHLYGQHALSLVEMERLKEATEMAHKAMDIAPPGELFGDTMADAQCILACGYAVQGDPKSLMRAVEITEDYLPHIRIPRNKMFHLFYAGRLYGGLGRTTEGLASAQAIAQIAGSTNDEAGKRLGSYTAGVALLESGRPEEAAEELTSSRRTNAKGRYEQCNSCSRAFLQIGEVALAETYLAEACQLAAEHGFATTDPDALARLL